MCWKDINAIEKKKTYIEKEVYVVIIINCMDVKWEIFTENTTLLQVIKYMKNMYQLNSTIISINEIDYTYSKSDRLKKYIRCNENSLTIKIHARKIKTI